MNMGARWLSVEEIAAHLGVNRDPPLPRLRRAGTVYHWIDEKAMPGRKVGRLWKFEVSEVDAWVQSGRAAAKPVRAKTGKAAPKAEKG
jgi:excisionase family DNA binding protein